MSTAPVCTYSVEEYLALERRSEMKHEFYKGELCAMTGGTEAHNVIVANLITAINLMLRGQNCRVYPSNMRVKCPSNLYTYPDVVLVCGDRAFDDSRKDTLLNPQSIIEVLSPSTEAYDRGKKFKRYREIESLKEYVLVSQDLMLVEQFTRQHDAAHWNLTELRLPNAELCLSTGNCRLSLSEIYENVEFAPADPNSEPAN